jgi:hypothetical protein
LGAVAKPVTPVTAGNGVGVKNPGSVVGVYSKSAPDNPEAYASNAFDAKRSLPFTALIVPCADAAEGTASIEQHTASSNTIRRCVTDPDIQTPEIDFAGPLP